MSTLPALFRILFQALLQNVFECRGVSGTTEESGGGRDEMMAAIKLAFVSPWKGRCPVAIS